MQIATEVMPPCRLGRRYDRRQRARALNAVFDLLRDVARDLQISSSQVRAIDLIGGDLIDDIAFALGLWMSPDTRD